MKNKTPLLVLVGLSLSAAAFASPTETLVANEIRNVSLSSEASVSEMAAVYNHRINDFYNTIQSRTSSTQEKKNAANSFLKYARSELNSQTGGSGLTFLTISFWIDSLEKDIQSGNFSAAAENAKTYAGSILNLI